MADDITWESIRALRRVVALFLAIAGFAERAAGRWVLLRWPALLVLRKGEAVARDRVVRLMRDFGVENELHALKPDPDASGAEQAAHLARSFRALAAAVATLVELLAAICPAEKPMAHGRPTAALRSGRRLTQTSMIAVGRLDSS